MCSSLIQQVSHCLQRAQKDLGLHRFRVLLDEQALLVLKLLVQRRDSAQLAKLLRLRPQLLQQLALTRQIAAISKSKTRFEHSPSFELRQALDLRFELGDLLRLRAELRVLERDRALSALCLSFSLSNLDKHRQNG